MSSYLTSSNLIDAVKREAMLPTNQATFTDDDFLKIANLEMKISVVPAILIYHQEYLVTYSAPITLVANQSNYAIPYRAIGGKFREVFYLDTSGQLRSMTRISPDQVPYYQSSNFQNRFIYFYLQGNDVVLLPPVGENPTGTLVFSYFLRPNELVDESRVSTIQSISVNAMQGTTSYTVDIIPTNLTSFTQKGMSYTGFTPSVQFDVLQTNPGHRTWALDISPISIDSVNKIITFNTSDVSPTSTMLNQEAFTTSSIVAGDYIAIAGESIIPQIPTDMHDVLAQRVAARCLESLGDQAGLQAANARIKEMEFKSGSLIDNRSEGQAIKINNLTGTLRSSKMRKRGWM